MTAQAVISPAVKERPILFSGSMVRAIREDLKTMTRRVMKRNVPESLGDGVYRWRPSGKPDFEAIGDSKFDVPSGWAAEWCPYGCVGDRLWVKETFWACDQPGMGDVPCLVYADEHYGKDYQHEIIRPGLAKFGHIPGIFMPRKFSRITLEITGVRVERLQDISEEDAMAEGCQSADFATGRECILEPSKGSYRLHFQSLWDSINGKTHPWASNPWLWVVEFKQVPE